MSLSGLARCLLLRRYLSLVHVLHSRLRSLDASPLHEEACAQQLCRTAVSHGVRGRRGTKGVVFSPSEDIPSDLKETEAHLRTAAEVRESGGWGSSPGRRSKSLSETGKKRRATTPSIHLGVPDSFSVTPGNGGIWPSKLGWRTVCVTSTRTTSFFSCAFCQRACPSLLSQLSLQVTVISSRIDFTHLRGSSTT